MGFYLSSFAVSLGLTLLLEFPVTWCFGLRSRRMLTVFLLVNLLTNPAAVLLHLFGIPQLPIELAVVVTEWFVYRQFRVKKPLALSVCANAWSWGLGLVINQIF